MAPRLLSLLTDIETAIVQHGDSGVGQLGQRSVSFHKGRARIIFTDGSGYISLQNFTLADGQICVRANFALADGVGVGSHAIYPREDFDWSRAAKQIAAAWMAVQEQNKQSAKPVLEAKRSAAEVSLEQIEATG